jgi:hypothetical protein
MRMSCPNCHDLCGAGSDQSAFGPQEDDGWPECWEIRSSHQFPGAVVRPRAQALHQLDSALWSAPDRADQHRQHERLTRLSS